MRKVLAVAATASVLALAACGSTTGSSALSDIKVTPAKDANAVPEVSFDTPYLSEKDEALTVVEGDGADVKAGDTISIKSGLYKAIDGKLTNENFTGQASEMVVDDTLKQQMPDLYNLLITSQVGDWIAYAAVDGTPQADGSMKEPEPGSRAERIILIDIEKSTTPAPPSEKLSEDEVKKLKSDKKLPTVSFDGDQPKIAIPKDVEEPKGLAIDVLEEGTKGKAATEESTVKAKYLGVQWSDGKKFDGNFDKDATEFPLNGVIKGWTQGLSGLKAGSKVMLTIPADLAYGDSSASGGPSGTLVFYVELLEVK